MPPFISPGADGMIGHFQAVDSYVKDVQNQALRKLKAGSRSRLTQYEREINASFDHLFYDAHSYRVTSSLEAYTNGHRSVYGVDPFQLTPDDMQNVYGYQDELATKFNNMEKFSRADTHRWINQVRRTPPDKLKDVRPIRGISHPNGKGSTSKYRLSSEAEMQIRANESRAYNQGVIEAAIKKKIGWIEVKDGPGCGWTSHDDGDKADGMIIQVGDPIVMIAHPHCQRQFIPRPDIKDDRGRGAKRLSASKILAFSLAGAAAAGGTRALFQITTTIIDPELALKFDRLSRVGSPYQKIFNALMDKYQAAILAQRADAKILRLPFYAEQPPDPEPFGIAVGQNIDVRSYFGEKFTGAPNLRGYQNSVANWGDAILDKRIKLPQAPDWAKKAMHILDNDSEAMVRKKISSFAEWVHATRKKENTLEVGARILNFHAKRRHWNEFKVLQSADRFGGAIRLTWTKYGPRTNIDMTDFMRGSITLTKSGVRRRITFNPRGNLRTALGMTQDGTLVGAIRLVPNHMLRALIEIDDAGKLVGNIRLVPKGPFRVILHFETPRPKNWQYQGLTPGKDFVDLRHKVLRHNHKGEVVEQLDIRKARGFGLDDFSLRDIYDTFRKLQLKNVYIEVDIYRASLFDIYTRTKIPVPQIRETIERLRAAGVIRAEGHTAELAKELTGYSGKFTFPPTLEQLKELQEAFGKVTTTVSGNIKFTKLPVEYREFLPVVGTRVHLQGVKFQDLYSDGGQKVKSILTSVRMSGLEPIKNARGAEIFRIIFDLPGDAWEAFSQTMDEVDNRIVVFLRHNQRPPLKIGRRTVIPGGQLFGKPRLTPQMVEEVFENRYAKLAAEIQVDNRLQLFRGTLEAIRGRSESQVMRLTRKGKRSQSLLLGSEEHRKWLRIMGDIQPWDGPGAVERKLQDLVYFMRAMELDNDTITEVLDAIKDVDIHLAAADLAFENRKLLRQLSKLVKKEAEELHDLEMRLPDFFYGPRPAGRMMEIILRQRANLDVWISMHRELLDSNKIVRTGVQVQANMISRARLHVQSAVLDRLERRGEISPVREMQGILGRLKGQDVRIDVKTSNIINKVDRDKYPELWADVERVGYAYDQFFPNLPKVTIQVGSFDEFYSGGKGIATGAFYRQPTKISGDGNIFINPLTAKIWHKPLLRKMNEAAVRRGHFAPGESDPIAMIAHEMGHHVHDSMVRYADWYGADPTYVDDMMEAAYRALGEPIFRADADDVWSAIYPGEAGFTPKPGDYVFYAKQRVSSYGGTNIHEAWAEMIAHYVTADKVDNFTNNMIIGARKFYNQDLPRMRAESKVIREEMRQEYRKIHGVFPPDDLEQDMAVRFFAVEDTDAFWDNLLEVDPNLYDHVANRKYRSINKVTDSIRETATRQDRNDIVALAMFRMGFSVETISAMVGTPELILKEMFRSGMKELVTKAEKFGVTLREIDHIVDVADVLPVGARRTPVYTNEDILDMIGWQRGTAREVLGAPGNEKERAAVTAYDRTSAAFNSWLAAGRDMGKVDSFLARDLMWALENAKVTHHLDRNDAHRIEEFLRSQEDDDDFLRKTLKMASIDPGGHEHLMERLDRAMEELEENFASALDKVGREQGFPRPPVVYRGIRDQNALYGLLSMNPGDRVRFDLYSSTSPMLETADAFGIDNAILEIIPRAGGDGGAYIDSSELEYILHTGSEFILESIEPDVEVWYLGYGGTRYWVQRTIVRLRQL